MKPVDLDALYTLTDAAEITGFSRAWLAREIRKGRGPVVLRFGSIRQPRYRVRGSDLLAWHETKAVPPNEIQEF